MEVDGSGRKIGGWVEWRENGGDKTEVMEN